MSFFKHSEGDAFQTPGKPDDPGLFSSEWPSETRGDGRLRANNRRTGSAQGAGSFKRKVSCRQCGFIMDLNRDDHSGGSLDGNGAGRTITKAAATVTNSRGDTYTDNTGDQAHVRGGGCPLCFSKNGSIVKLEEVAQLQPLPNIGF